MDTALESSVYVSSPEFAGWLMKRGFHWRKLWKKRWVALHGAEIVYMEKEPTLEDTGNMTITKAQISSETVIDREDLDGNPFGFAIHINDGQSPPWYLRAESAREKKSWLMRLSHVHSIVRWLENFERIRVLGVGGSGIVHELLHKSNGRRFAMKEMEIKNKTQMQMAVQEAEMLKDIMENVSHPNLMHIEKVFQVGSKFYMLFPLCTGGELYEHIIRKGHFTELDAARLLRDLVSGIHALHERDILHLDIKPENILFDSSGDDAKIKITDFGLSRHYEQVKKEQKVEFSMELMMEKLKAFADSGELNRDRLRGTIGYMSPELILLGYCNKTTDVFAAGVVLYILLCGRPPFNSRSNREVLERTAKGLYKMAGPDWDEISDDAKDLVRKMLDTDPLRRISTSDILAHPWLSDLDEPTEEPKEAESADQSIGSKIIGKKLSSRRGNGANLAGALKHLSGHVERMRSEKLASTMTRLLSMMQSDDSGRSTLSKHYLISIDQSAASQKVVEPDAVMMELMSSQFHTVFTKALQHLGIFEQKGIPIKMFAAVMRHFNPSLQVDNSDDKSKAGSSNSGNNANNQHGLIYTQLLLLSFIDGDGDGYVSIEDLRNSQAQMLQRNERFLRTLFRVYIESLWYPGRHLNLINLQQQMKLRNFAATEQEEEQLLKDEDINGVKNISASPSGKKVLDANGYFVADVMEAPRFITARHVAAIFERAGFDSRRGQEVFRILCDAASKLKGEKDDITYGKSEKELKECIKESSIAQAESTTDAPAASSDPVPNAALVAALRDSELLETRPSIAAANESNGTASTGATSSTPAAPNATVSLSNAKMDVNDFIRVCALDDILVQVLFQRSHQRMMAMMEKLESASAMLSAGGSIPEENEIRDSECDAAPPAPMNRSRSSVDIKAELLAGELRLAFESLRMDEQTPMSKKNRLANAIGGAAIYIAKGAQALKEAAYDLDGSGVGRESRHSMGRGSIQRALDAFHDSDDEV